MYLWIQPITRAYLGGNGVSELADIASLAVREQTDLGYPMCNVRA